MQALNSSSQQTRNTFNRTYASIVSTETKSKEQPLKIHQSPTEVTVPMVMNKAGTWIHLVGFSRGKLKVVRSIMRDLDIATQYVANLQFVGQGNLLQAAIDTRYVETFGERIAATKGRFKIVTDNRQVENLRGHTKIVAAAIDHESIKRTLSLDMLQPRTRAILVERLEQLHAICPIDEPSPLINQNVDQGPFLLKIGIPMVGRQPRTAVSESNQSSQPNASVQGVNQSKINIQEESINQEQKAAEEPITSQDIAVPCEPKLINKNQSNPEETPVEVVESQVTQEHTESNQNHQITNDCLMELCSPERRRTRSQSQEILSPKRNKIDDIQEVDQEQSLTNSSNGPEC